MSSRKAGKRTKNKDLNEKINENPMNDFDPFKDAKPFQVESPLHISTQREHVCHQREPLPRRDNLKDSDNILKDTDNLLQDTDDILQDTDGKQSLKSDLKASIYSSVATSLWHDLCSEWKSILKSTKGSLAHDPPQSDEEQVLRNDRKTNRLLNLFSVPARFELFSGLGYLICLDAFLHVFTILPLKITLIIFNVLLDWFSCLRSAKKITLNVTAHQKNVLLNGTLDKILIKLTPCLGLLIIIPSILLQSVDASRLYHSIRGQAIIKLYVIFNALEICDKLACAFGHDILDSLFYSSLKPINQRWYFNNFARFVMSCVYIYAHTLILFYQAMSLNVAINSYNNALLTLLISNQFVEIKVGHFL